MNRNMPPVGAATTAISAVAIALLVAVAVVRAEGADERDDLIRVSGESVVLVAPDHATVSASAEARDAESSVALRQADERMVRVIAAVRKLGVSDEDFTTEAVRVHREPDVRPVDLAEEQKDAGWVATSTLRVELDDLELVGTLIAAVSEAGAQQVSGPSYSVRDADAAYERALAEAMDRARDKADAIARSASARVGDIYAVEEAGSDTAVFAGASLAADEAVGGAAITVNPGETEQVRASVTVSYTLD